MCALVWPACAMQPVQDRNVPLTAPAGNYTGGGWLGGRYARRDTRDDARRKAGRKGTSNTQETTEGSTGDQAMMCRLDSQGEHSQRAVVGLSEAVVGIPGWGGRVAGGLMGAYRGAHGSLQGGSSFVWCILHVVHSTQSCPSLSEPPPRCLSPPPRSRHSQGEKRSHRRPL